MKQHLNTLFLQTDGVFLRKQGQTLAVHIERELKARVPVHTIGGVVCLGRATATSAALALCAENGVSVTFLTSTGRLLARVTGFTPGNVLLRRDQYRVADDEQRCAAIAGAMVATKIANSRTVLLRAARDHGDPDGALAQACGRMAQSAESALRAPDLDVLRGIEGEAAREYFSVVGRLVTLPEPHEFALVGRSRRPPRDRMNCVLSFLYALLGHDARSACEAAGLDPAVGFLHRDRPGRPSLALDLMEELRSVLCDRLALSMVNRKQLTARDFDVLEGGAVRLTDRARREVLVAYQKRKQDEVTHAYLDERVTLGLVVHLQARLLSRVLRGELDTYPAFVWR